MKEVRGLLVIHLPSNIFHHTSSDCTGGRRAMQFDTASQNKFKKKSFIKNGKILREWEAEASDNCWYAPGDYPPCCSDFPK